MRGEEFLEKGNLVEMDTRGDEKRLILEGVGGREVELVPLWPAAGFYLRGKMICRVLGYYDPQPNPNQLGGSEPKVFFFLAKKAQWKRGVRNWLVSDDLIDIWITRRL